MKSKIIKLLRNMDLHVEPKIDGQSPDLYVISRSNYNNSPFEEVFWTIYKKAEKHIGIQDEIKTV
jgi:hypothetical protein